LYSTPWSFFMRRAFIAAVAGAITLGSVAVAVPSQAASVGNPLPVTQFGQHFLASLPA